jgi:hypothetical protein
VTSLAGSMVICKNCALSVKEVVHVSKEKGRREISFFGSTFSSHCPARRPVLDCGMAAVLFRAFACHRDLGERNLRLVRLFVSKSMACCSSCKRYSIHFDLDGRKDVERLSSQFFILLFFFEGHLPSQAVLMVPFIIVGNLAVVFLLEKRSSTFAHRVLIPAIVKAAIVGVAGQLLIWRGVSRESEARLLAMCVVQFATSCFGIMMGSKIAQTIGEL